MILILTALRICRILQEIHFLKPQSGLVEADRFNTWNYLFFGSMSCTLVVQEVLHEPSGQYTQMELWPFQAPNPISPRSFLITCLWSNKSTIGTSQLPHHNSDLQACFWKCPQVEMSCIHPSHHLHLSIISHWIQWSPPVTLNIWNHCDNGMLHGFDWCMKYDVRCTYVFHSSV